MMLTIMQIVHRSNCNRTSKLTTTTIYYKGYDNPYIHYRIADGTWTTAPGVKMEENLNQMDITMHNNRFSRQDTLEAR